MKPSLPLQIVRGALALWLLYGLGQGIWFLSSGRGLGLAPSAWVWILSSLAGLTFCLWAVLFPTPIRLRIVCGIFIAILLVMIGCLGWACEWKGMPFSSVSLIGPGVNLAVAAAAWFLQRRWPQT
jgi:hypothetical protein